MSDAAATTPGSIVWHDLTIPDADTLSEFYASVCGWQRTSLPEHDGDFTMHRSGESEAVAGVCYARGVNAHIPPQWLMYVAVANLAASLAETERLGGRCVEGPRLMGGHHFCVIQDPAGAYIALISPLAVPAINEI